MSHITFNILFGENSFKKRRLDWFWVNHCTLVFEGDQRLWSSLWQLERESTWEDQIFARQNKMPLRSLTKPTTSCDIIVCVIRLRTYFNKHLTEPWTLVNNNNTTWCRCWRCTFQGKLVWKEVLIVKVWHKSLSLPVIRHASVPETPLGAQLQHFMHRSFCQWCASWEDIR